MPSKDNFYKKRGGYGLETYNRPLFGVCGVFFYFVFSFLAFFICALHLLKIICITSLLLDNPLFSV